MVFFDKILDNITMQGHVAGESLGKGVYSGGNAVARISNGLKEMLSQSSYRRSQLQTLAADNLLATFQFGERPTIYFSSLQVKDVYGLDDEVPFRNVNVPLENRPRPLHLGTATQIGWHWSFWWIVFD